MAIPVAIILAAAAVVAGGIKAYAGSRQAKRAREAIEGYDRQELKNVYEGLKVSTLGSELVAEEGSRVDASLIDLLQQGGTQGLGLVGDIQGGSNERIRKERADIDLRMDKREYAIAGDDARIRSLYEAREISDLQGLGQLLNVGQQNFYGGLGDVQKGVSSAATSGAFDGDGAGDIEQPTG